MLCRLMMALAAGKMHVLTAQSHPAAVWAVVAGKVLQLAVLPLALQLPFSQHLAVQAACLTASLMGLPWDCANIMSQVGSVLAPTAEVGPLQTGPTFTLGPLPPSSTPLQHCMQEHNVSSP